MYIGEYKTKNKKTGEVYVQHKLMESVRTEKGPRHRVVMNLGALTVPRVDWKRLAHALECRITGQQSLLEGDDRDLEVLALSLVSNKKLSKALEKPGGKPETPEPSQAASFIVSSVKTKQRRGVGAELLCKSVWDMLGFADILKKLRFSAISISLAMVLLFGRMIDPGSERQTIEWFRKRSALQELPGVADLSKCGKDRFYDVADDLFDKKELIEDMLFQREREFFPHTEATIYLYDLTNTYLEGHGLRNGLAARGHCKSKRYDCPLMALSLVVDDGGMPICSQIYKGNQSEPETMESMMMRLSQRMYGSQQIPMIKPTVAMDQGIATKDNVKWLRDNGYNYIVIKREDYCEKYRSLFETGRKKFELVSSKKGIYGDLNNVYIHKEPIDGDMCRVLCISEGKARKEKAIAEKKAAPFLDDIKNLNKSIKKGTIKNPETITNKLHRLMERHGKCSAKYEASIEKEADGKITKILLSKKAAAPEPEPLYGCYVIETSHPDMSAKEIWKLYMTLTRVESAFRSMKETLGLRPIYHQTAKRTQAHLFLTVLAYHLLATIENLLTQQGDTRTWETIRKIMTTVTRGTVTMQDTDGVTYSIRITDEPEDIHQDVFDKLKIRVKQDPIVIKFHEDIAAP